MASTDCHSNMSQLDGPSKMPERLPIGELMPKEKTLLTNILQRYECDPDIRVTDVKFVKPLGPSENHQSQIKTATVSAKKANGSYIHRSYIMKFQLQDKQKQMAFMSDEVWANEEFMYRNVLPAMAFYCKENLPYPKYYYSDSNLIVLENLGDSGYHMADRLAGLDLDHTLLVLDTLAYFHAASRCMQLKDNKTFSNIKQSFQHPYAKAEVYAKMSPYINQHIMNAISVLRDHRSDGKYDGAINFLTKLTKDHDIFLSIGSPPVGTSAVFIHGDAWVNNILFSHDSLTKRPLDVKFIDFQATRPGAAAMDILYFLYTSVQSKVRREKYEYLIQFYHHSCISHLRRFLENTHEEYVANFTFENFLKELDRYRQFGLINAVLLLPVLTAGINDTVNFLDADPNNNNDTYKEKLIDVVDEYVDNDWIKSD